MPAYAQAPGDSLVWKPLPKIEITEPKKEVYDDKNCSCVVYVRERGLPLPPIYTPNDLEPNAEARPGAAILLDYNEPHIGFVTSSDGSQVCFDEANFRRCQMTHRCIPIDDPVIRGYWFPG